MMRKPEIVWLSLPDKSNTVGWGETRNHETDIPAVPLDALEAEADRLRVKQGACRLDMEDERYNQGIDDLLAWFQQQAAERQK